MKKELKINKHQYDRKKRYGQFMVKSTQGPQMHEYNKKEPFINRKHFYGCNFLISGVAKLNRIEQLLKLMSSVHFHMSAGNQEYRIKEIIKIELAWLSNRNEPELYFKLKWSDDSTSYEPKSNLTNCNEAINEYIEKLIEEGKTTP